MTNPNDGKLELIRKLLAKAEGTTNEAEAAAFNAKAAELIAQYGIDAALLANQSQVREEVGDRVLKIQAPYGNQKAMLFWAIATPNGVRAVWHSKQRELHVFGFAADIERVEILFTSLLTQAAFGMLAETPPMRKFYDYQLRDWVEKQEDTRTYRISWLTGFTDIIGERMRQAVRSATQEADTRLRDAGSTVSTALVLADRKTQIDRRVKEMYPKLGTLRSTVRGSGRESGRAAGRRADLGGTRVNTGARGAVGR